MTIKAALLDDRGMFLRIDEVASSKALTARHLPQIRACDLPPGRYLWIPDERKRDDGTPVNEYGGAFWEIDWLRRINRDLDTACAVEKELNRFPPEFRNAELTALVDYLRACGLGK